MRGFARLVIAGNLGGDPDMRYLPSGTLVSNFSVAVNRRETRGGEQRDATDWYRITCFGKLAEIADQYLRKGAPVLIDGRPQLEQWTDRDGNVRLSVQVIADGFTMLGQRDEDADGESSGALPVGRANAASPSAPTAAHDGVTQEDLDDVPF